MTGEFVLNAETRRDTGKGASRRLRRESQQLPAIIYGGDQAPENITLTLREISKVLENEVFYSSVITLKVDGKPQDVVLKALQRHPATEFVLHADFQRVVKDQKMTLHIPVRFVGEEKSPALKLQGGVVSHQVTELEIRCLPKDIPDFIEVDLSQVSVGDSVHISSLKLPDGVESIALTHGTDLTLATVFTPRGNKADEAADAATSAASKAEDEKKKS